MSTEAPPEMVFHRNISKEAKMRRIFAFWALVLFLAAPGMAVEKVDSVRFITEEWPGYTEKDGTGLYWEVLKTVYEPVAIKIEYTLVPWNRAKKTVLVEADALVASSIFDPIPGTLLAEHPIDGGYSHVLFRKGENQYAGPQSFKLTFPK